MKCLILEDEPLAAENLKQMLLKVVPDIAILDIIETVNEAEQWLKTHAEPDLIFMDIHLADCLCFELFDRIHFSSPVIFTTAYDQYAIAAFQTNGICYLLKPIEEEQLIAAIKKFQSLTSTQLNSIQNLLNAGPRQQSVYRQRILVKLGDNYTQLPISEIAYFYSEDHYTFLTTRSDQRFIVNHTLDALESQLEPTQFFRISRQCTVSIDSIVNVTKHFNGRLRITLNPPFKGDTLVSRNRVSSFLSWLDGSNATTR